ncbi:MAG: hypothetical protein WBA97_08150 [Actinophytocola sp.]|uniref:hypothetical protein n=1 Tax=Actinophytocola sp. TaxID=1872138 RepID=UPI003C790FC2
MNKATTQIHFAVVDNELEVSAPPALAPVTDFFETEIGTSDTMLDLIEHHVRHDQTWRFTGDTCHLSLDAETVTIEHNYTGASTNLTRTDLKALLTNLRDILAESDG